MAQKDDKREYDDVMDEARWMTEGAAVPLNDPDFSLEEILAEYGGSREQKLMRDVERAAEPEPPAVEERQRLEPEKTDEEIPPAGGTEKVRTKPEPQGEKVRTSQPKAETVRPEPKPPEQEPPHTGSKQTPSPPEQDLTADLPEPPRPVSMEDVVGRTVDAVRQEQKQRREARSADRRPQRGLFTRKRMEPQDTEELYQRPERMPEPELPPEPEEEPIGPEPPLSEAATDTRLREKQRRKALTPSAVITAALAAVLLADSRGYVLPLWTGNARLQTAVQLAAVLLVSLLCRNVFQRGFGLLTRRRWSGELLASVSAIITGLDCCARLLLPDRTDAAPYALTACAALLFAQWGIAQSEKALFDTYRAASITETPPYLVTNTPQGACKQRGRVEGFYTDSIQDDLSLMWQTLLVPVIFMGTIVFAGLSSLGQGRKADLLLCWSAILSASASLALPLSWSLPWSKLAKRLQKAGCAVAGWAGAEAITRKRAMILTDLDLFPPGSVHLNGIKVYGEELPHAVSYAASLARESGSGLLARLFEGALRSEGGRYYKLNDFSFYEEGGCSANIRGETVMLGTASFMRKMEVRLPGNINLKTGLYLSVDRQLAAVFAVKYTAADNVDWALRMLKRNHVTPILASRDPNITPALIKRKFSKGIKVEYPPLAGRLALSEQEDGRGRPRALLLREGLLPYADTVVGARRLRRGVRGCTILALLGSIAGTLLAYYLAFRGDFALMRPLTLLEFQLLWVIPVLLLSDWTGRY